LREESEGAEDMTPESVGTIGEYIEVGDKARLLYPTEEFANRRRGGFGVKQTDLDRCRYRPKYHLRVPRAS